MDCNLAESAVGLVDAGETREGGDERVGRVAAGTRADQREDQRIR